MSLTSFLCEIMSTRWLKTRCSQSICHQLSSFYYRTYFLPRERERFFSFLSLSHAHSIQTSNIDILSREKNSLSPSCEYTQNLIYCIHALVRPNSINNLTRGGNERDFPYSLVEPYNDDSISLTHTWYSFSLRLNPCHRVIVRSRLWLYIPDED